MVKCKKIKKAHSYCNCEKIVLLRSKEQEGQLGPEGSTWDMVMDGDRLVLGRQREVGGFGTDFVARASRTHW